MPAAQCVSYAENPCENKLKRACDLHNIRHMEGLSSECYGTRWVKHQRIATPIGDLELCAVQSKQDYSYGANEGQQQYQPSDSSTQVYLPHAAQKD